jgi:hypothetical protein
MPPQESRGLEERENLFETFETHLRVLVDSLATSESALQAEASNLCDGESPRTWHPTGSLCTSRGVVSHEADCRLLRVACDIGH